MINGPLLDYHLQKCVRCCTCSVTEWPCDELCQIKTWEGHLASQDIPVSATLLRCAGLVLVVERGAVVAADPELLDPHAAVVLLHRGDHHVFEPQPREGGSNSSSVFDFRVLKRVQRQFPSAETQETTIGQFLKTRELHLIPIRMKQAGGGVEGDSQSSSHIRPLNGRKDNATPPHALRGMKTLNGA